MSCKRIKLFLDNKLVRLLFVFTLVIAGGLFANSAQAAIVNTSVFTSKVENFNTPVYFDQFNWTATVVNGVTDVTMEVRSGSTPTPTSDTDANWTAWTSVTNGQYLSAPIDGKQYFQYRATLTSQNINSVSSLDDVQINWSYYDTVTNSLTSSAYDSMDPANALGGVAWSQDASTPANTTVNFYVRTGADTATLAAASWVQVASTTSGYLTSGCTNTNGSISCTSAVIPAGMKDGAGDEWLQYKIELSSNGLYTPTIGDVTVKYVVNAPPEIDIQNVPSQATDGKVMVDYEARDIDTNTGATPGKVAVDLQYCTANCGNVGAETWTSASAGALSGDFGANVSINQGAPDQYTSHSLIWNPKIDYNTHYNPNNFKIRLVANDSEGANNLGKAVSNIFVLDTTDPVISSFVVDSRSTSANVLTMSVTDNTMDSLQMKLSNHSDLSADGLNTGSGTWINYAATKNWNLSGDPESVYYQFKDKYGNVSAAGVISHTTIPAQPSNIAYQDVSTVLTSEWREFVAWGVIDEPELGFKQYDIYRSNNGVDYTLLATQTDRKVNYILDANLDTTKAYYYKIAAEDNNGNVSNYSSVVFDVPNGQGGSDLTSPSISGVSTDSISTQSAVITWNTNEPSDSIVEYITTPGGDFTNAPSQGVATMADSATGLGKHSVTINGLIPNTTYYFQVKSADPSGNLATSKDGANGYYFTTLNGPKISNVSASSVDNKRATITWNTDVASDSYIVYSANPDLSSSNQIGISNSVTFHAVNITGLTTGLKYYYYVKSGVAEDKNVVAGNINYYSFNTTGDLIPPVITFATSTDITNITDTTAVISWETNELATSSLVYGLDTNYASSSNNNGLNTSHTYFLSGLSRGTQYHFQLRNADANGNVVASPDYTFSTTDSSDHTPPVITFATSTDITNITDTSVTIKWATNKVASSKLEYGLDTSYASSTTNNYLNSTHSYTINGLTKSTLYHFRLSNTDASGNSATSSDYTFVTTDSADYTPPVINFATSTGITDITDNGAVISWTTNELATSSLSYGVNTNYGSSTLNNNYLNSSHTYTLTGLTKGTQYHLKLSNADASGNAISSGDFVFTTTDTSDKTPPVITFDVLSGVTDISNNSATIKWTTDEVATSKLEYGLDTSYASSTTNTNLNSTHAYTLTDLIKGTTYHFRLTNTDASGNATSSSDYTFSTIDNTDYTPPVITFATSTSITDITDNGAVISWTTNELATSSIRYGLNTSYASSTINNNLNTSHTYTLTGLVKGTLYHVKLGNTDASGNTAVSSDFTFSTTDSTDHTPPIITFDSLTGITGITNTSATISWTTNKVASSELDYGLDTNYTSSTTDANLNSTHSFTISGLTKATAYHFRLSNTDANGNYATSTDYTFSTVDTSDYTPPVITFATSTSITGITDISAIISWSTNEMATSSLRYGVDTSYASNTLTNDHLNTSHTYTLSGLTRGTQYHIQLGNSDASGNTAVSGDFTFATTDSGDHTPPVITFATSTDITGITNNFATISWTTNEVASSKLDYGLDTSYASSTSSMSLNSSHSYTITDLTKATLYHFRLTNTDASGNTVTSSDYTFSTIDTTDYTPPVITFDVGDITNITDSGAVISWTTNKMSTSSLSFGTDTTYASSTLTNDHLNTSHMYAISGLTKGTEYHIKLRNTDASGNTAVSNDFVFSTINTTDTIPPVITFATSTSITGITDTTAVISWTTNEAATSSLRYGTDTGYGTTLSNPNLNTSHLYLLTGLTKGTEYHIQLENADASGNIATSDDYTFTTLEVSNSDDKTPPVITFDATSGVTNITNTSATINWSTDETASSKIEYGLDTNYNSNVIDSSLNSTHSYTLNGLTKNTTYHFRLNNTDPSGNMISSSDYTFTTIDTTDYTPPVMTFASSTDITNVSDTSAVISWVTDEVASSSLSFGIDTTYASSTLTNDYLNTSHTYNISGLNKGTTYHFQMKNTDASGNTAVSEDFTFTTTDSSDKTPPIITFATSTDITNITNTSVVLNWLTNEVANSKIEYGEDTSYASSSIDSSFNTNHSYALTDLKKNTTYHFRITSADAAGNSASTDDYTFTTIDTTDYTPPVITFATSTDITNLTDNSFTISWTTNELATSSVAYGLNTSYASSSDINNNLNTDHSVTISGLSSGTQYHVQLRNTDASGNTAVSDDIIVLTTDISDKSLPMISDMTTDPVFDTVAVVNWDTNKLTSARLEYSAAAGTSTVPIVDKNLNKTHSIVLDSLTASTKYNFTITATDSNNVATSTQGTFTTAEPLVGETEVKRREDVAKASVKQTSSSGGMLIIDKTDKTPPIISDILVSDIKSSAATVTWTTNENADGYVDFGDTTDYGSVAGKRTRVLLHQAVLTNLQAAKTYHYKISSVDASGNYAEAEDASFTTISLEQELSSNPSLGGSTSSSSPSTPNTPVATQIESAQNLFKLANQAVQRAVGIIKSSASKISLNFMESSLANQQGSIDELANLLPMPVMSGSPLVVTTDKTASITWRTDKDSNSLVAYAASNSYNARSSQPYTQVVGNATEKTVDHTVTLTGLEPNTTYHYQLESKAAVGATAKSGDFTFTTQPEAFDIQKYVVKNISKQEVSFQWVTSANSDALVEYTPYKNNKLDETQTKKKYDKTLTTIHEIGVDDLSGGVSYRVTLSSKDANNKIVEKIIDKFTTSEVDSAPAIDQVQTISAISPGKNIKIQTVISWLTDEPSTSKVYYKKGVAKVGDKLPEETKLDENYTKKHVVVITKFDAGSVYSFQTESIDYNGKITLSKIYTILTPKQEESVFQVIVKNLEGMFGWVNKMN